MFTLRNLWIVPMRGVGQVLFQENALSGALMLLGIAVGSPTAALLALAGNVLGNLAARVFRYPVADIERGLYGFNGTLVGIAVGVFFPLGWQAALLLVAGSVASSPIARIFARCRIPGFTAPFILSTWLLLGIAALLWPALRTSGGTAAIETAPEWLQALSLHFGQVMFEGRSLLTGALFLAGIAVNERRGALYALWGALLPLGMAFFADDYAAFNAGLYGYNGVLGMGFRACDLRRPALHSPAMVRNAGGNRHSDRTLRHGRMGRDGGRPDIYFDCQFITVE